MLGLLFNVTSVQPRSEVSGTHRYYAGLSYPNGRYGAFWEKRCWPLRVQHAEHADEPDKQVSAADIDNEIRSSVKE